MKELIEWSKIDFKGKTSGEITSICPNCSADRKKKTDKCLGVNLDKGIGKCNHCLAVTYKPTESKKEYKLPLQTWKNYTSISDPVVKWFKDVRNISQQTLIECGITEEDFYQPQKKKKVKNIVFNYFEGNVVVNKKYRSSDKCFTQSKEAKKIFYGLNDIVDCEEVYIVEGEMDKLAFWEVGIKNCISVPNGANDLSDFLETCSKYIENIKKFFIAVDTDEAGKKLEHELIKRFGKWRCERIDFKGKDANDDLKLGKLELLESIQSPIQYPVEGTHYAKDSLDKLLYFRTHKREYIKPKNECFEDFNKIFSLLPGQLTTVTGIPSHGKSNFVEDYVLNLVNDCDLKASFFSPEHEPKEAHWSVFLEKIIGKSYEEKQSNEQMSSEEIIDGVNWLQNKVYKTSAEDDTPANWNWLLDTFRQQIFRFGIDVFVIDAFNKVKRNSPDSLGEINDILSKLTAFAQAHEIHVILIAHPVKMRKNELGQYDCPSLYDVKGSGDFRDQTHNGFVVFRDFENNSVMVKNLKTKFKGQGEINECVFFDFDAQNGRYRKQGTQVNRKSFIKSVNKQIEIEKPKEEFKMKANVEFDVDINATIEPKTNDWFDLEEEESFN